MRALIVAFTVWCVGWFAYDVTVVATTNSTLDFWFAVGGALVQAVCLISALGWLDSDA